MVIKAYASLVSLINTMDLIQIHPLISTCFDKYQIESLREKIDFLLEFVENHSDAAEAEDLVRRIAVVAHDVEGIIEVQAADRIRSDAAEAEDLVRRIAVEAHDAENIIEVQAADRIRVEKSRTIYRRLRRIIKDLVRRSRDAPHDAEDHLTEVQAADQVRDAAHEAEDLSEVQAADQVHVASTQSGSCSFFDNLQKIMIDMDSIKEEVIKAKEENGLFITRFSLPPSSSSSSTPPTTAAKTTSTIMVGFEGYVDQLLDQLTGYHRGRQIIPIVGMGGIGKTTLAKNVYESSHSVHHFDVRAWVTVSQEFNASKILSQALSCLGRSTSTTVHYDQLGEELSKSLYGRRYLVVLDDVWSVEAWEKIMFFFPNNSNGSRIVITTRQQELVDYFSSSAVVIKFLDDEKSWELFCEKTFGQQSCPHPELEQVGKKIVKKCKGLPLAINVIGGFLGKSPTQEYWEKIAEHKSLVLDSGEDNEVTSILYLSYKNLPIRLKPCFLYFGLFPEDDTIDVSKLIKLWVAEGFIKPNLDQSLEEIGEYYLKELLDRNLLLAGGWDEYRKSQSCSVHDLVRDMCVRIAKREDIFCVERDIDARREFKVDEMRAWFYSHKEWSFHSLTTLKRPSVDCPEILEEQRGEPFKSRLFRVLFNFDGVVELDTTLREVNLRFLNQSWFLATKNLPSSISLLWSLQTLIIARSGSTMIAAPAEIWMMPQLRHIQIDLIVLPDPPSKDDTIVLRNLQTLERVSNLIFSENICKRIPNIKELEIEYDFDGVSAASSCYHMQHVGCLNKLEVLQCTCWGWTNSCDSLQNLKLPSSLKELCLSGCKLEWSKMAMIASLPHLHTLTLKFDAVVGAEWNFSDEEEFLCLRHLYISVSRDLINWNAESSNFPVLETLDLSCLWKLEEIPSGIGEIPTLERINMDYCIESANISAVKMLEEQESLGNESLKLTLKIFPKSEENMLREKIQEMGFTCKNLIIC